MLSPNIVHTKFAAFNIAVILYAVFLPFKIRKLCLCGASVIKKLFFSYNLAGMSHTRTSPIFQIRKNARFLLSLAIKIRKCMNHLRMNDSCLIMFIVKQTARTNKSVVLGPFAIFCFLFNLP